MIRYKHILIFFILIVLYLFVSFEHVNKCSLKKQLKITNKSLVSTSSDDLKLRSLLVRPKYDVNCKLIFDMDSNEIKKAKLLLNSSRFRKFEESIKDDSFIFDRQKCNQFKKVLGYDQVKGSNPEFPLAFSILVHTNAEQLERFIRSIYQPQNIYCIHIDTKSKKSFQNAIRSIAQCFDNIFISTKSENILYGGFSRLKADINCLEDLLMLDNLVKTNKEFRDKRIVDWKYALNLVGTEYLLRTNEELVKILKMYNGSNEITILKTNRVLHRRIKNEWLEDFTKFRLVNSGRNKSAAPHGYVITYGFSSYVITKKFANYAVFDNRAQDLLNWVRTTWSPDEIYWSTLQYNTKIYSEHGFIGKNFFI